MTGVPVLISDASIFLKFRYIDSCTLLYNQYRNRLLIRTSLTSCIFSSPWLLLCSSLQSCPLSHACRITSRLTIQMRQFRYVLLSMHRFICVWPRVKYAGRLPVDANACRMNDTNIAASQPACYNVPSQCTSSAATSQSNSTSAFFIFKGDGLIHRNSTSSSTNGMYRFGYLRQLTLIWLVPVVHDHAWWKRHRHWRRKVKSALHMRQSLLTDGPRPQRRPHLSIKSASPNRSQTNDDVFEFSLINFMWASVWLWKFCTV